MDWRCASDQQRYTLTVGDYQARVWYLPSNEWAALISQHLSVIAHDFFTTLMEAQFWCKARLAQLQTKS